MNLKDSRIRGYKGRVKKNVSVMIVASRFGCTKAVGQGFSLAKII